MAISYLLAPVPKWYFADNFGRPLGAGKMYTYRNINKVQYKPVFQDQGGLFPWTQPVLFDENGMQGPFYWDTNSDDLTDTYYIEVYDKDNVLQFTIDDYFPPGEGGGGSTTNNISIKNLLANNIFLYNFVDSGSPISSTDFVIAPGAHMGMNPSMSNIHFIKDNLNQTDRLFFQNFPFSSNPLAGDVTPVQYLTYECTVAASETFKSIQIPITSKVTGLDSTQVTFTIWAQQTAGVANNLKAEIVQFYGHPIGTPSTSTFTVDFPLQPDWTKYADTITIPAAIAAPAACGDDGIFLRIHYPLDAVATINIALPRLYLGTVHPQADFDTNDQVVSIFETARTGDVRISLNDFAPFGWVPMNDGTIGSAFSLATTRKNIDTFPLFKTIYTNVSNANAPVSGGRTGNPEEDFAANKTIALTKQLGRALAGIGEATGGVTSPTDWVPGQFSGQENQVLTIAQMPSHTHPGPTTTAFWNLNSIVVNLGTSQSIPSYGAGDPHINTPVTINSVPAQGGGQSHSLIQPTTHYRIFMKL